LAAGLNALLICAASSDVVPLLDATFELVVVVAAAAAVDTAAALCCDDASAAMLEEAAETAAAVVVVAAAGAAADGTNSEKFAAPSLVAASSRGAVAKLDTGVACEHTHTDTHSQ
jgi:hypothetical protein